MSLIPLRRWFGVLCVAVPLPKGHGIHPGEEGERLVSAALTGRIVELFP